MRKSGNIITIKGQEFRLYGKPLDQYWEVKGNKPAFSFSSNPLDTGYFAHWIIEDDKLFLLEFVGEIMFSLEPVSFESQFPGKALPLHADWYSGTLQVQTGKQISHSHHFGAALQYKFSIEFKAGAQVNITMHDTI